MLSIAKREDNDCFLSIMLGSVGDQILIFRT